MTADDKEVISYYWHEASVPAELPITKVHGYLLCPATGRVLLKDDNGIMTLNGVRAGSF